MAETKVFDLQSAYSDLSRACSVQSYPKVLTISTKILSKFPSENKALQCKAVALIRTEKYDECLSVIKKFPDLVKCVLFEKAYAEYRLNRINDAIKTLQNTDPTDLRALELKAQVHYRREEFAEAYECLRNVHRNSQDDYGEERLTNLTAVAAAAALFHQECIDVDTNPEMYEAKFNLACFYLGRGEEKKAEAYLKESEGSMVHFHIHFFSDDCRAALAEDAEITEEEIDAELAPIRTQQAYLLQRADKGEVANQIHQSVTRNRSVDPALLAVAANNIVCINQEQNIFDSRKRIKMASVDGVQQHKLFAKQREEMLINQGLFYWHTNQADACHAKVKTVLQDNPRSSRAILLLVAQLLKEKQLDRAVSTLKNYCDNGSTISPTDLTLQLAAAQLRLRRHAGTATSLNVGLPQAGDALAAVELIEESLSQDDLHRLGLVCTRFVLYILACATDSMPSVIERTEAMSRVCSLIQHALDWHEASDDGKSAHVILLDRCADLLLEYGQAEFAARLYELQLDCLDNLVDVKQHGQQQGQQQQSRDTIKQSLLARLVRAYAQFDRPKAEAVCKSLQFTDTISEVEVDALETAFLYGAKAIKRMGRTKAGDQQPPSAQAKVVGKQNRKGKRGAAAAVSSPVSPIESNEPSSLLTQKKKKKKRPIRLPKDYQLGVVPDPDRWLPRRQRATYRGKRRDKQRHNPTRGPQGQVAGGSEWDASARSPKPSVSASPPTTETAGSTPKASTAGSSRQQRKGRKKGR